MVPLLVGLIAGAVYLVTQAPGLYYTDTGELAAAAHTWGVAHPTGYPLFTLIAHVWQMLPWPSVIKGLNILSALLVAATASVLTIVVRDVLRLTAPALEERPRTIIGAATALLWAFSPTVWAQTTAVEVYGLNTLLFVLALLALGLRVEGRGERGIGLNPLNSTLSGLVFGLMLANHLSSIFLAPGLLYWWWKMQPSAEAAKKRIGWLLAPSLLGPMMYLILPMRSAALPPINWGWVHRGWDAFVYHVKGTQFGVWMFSDSAAMRENTSTFFSLASQELLWIGWVGAVIGVVALWKVQRQMAIALLLLIVGNLGISLGYAIPDIDAYFLPTLTVLAILLGIGIGKLSDIKILHTFILSPFFVILGFISLFLNYPTMDHSSHRAVPAYTMWAMDHAQPRAIIITRQWDYMCSAFWYLQTVEGVRPDVVMIDKELIRRTWYLPHLQHLYPDVMKGAKAAIDAYMPWLEQFESDADAFKANPRNNAEIQRRFVDVLNAIVESNADRPIYITPEMMTDEQGFAAEFRAVPVGPLVRLSREQGTGNWERGSGNGEWGMGNVEEVVKSLAEKKTRLDSAMSALVVSNLASNAMYALQVNQDVGSFRFYRDLAVRLDPKDRTTRMLINQPLPQ
jgi:hypothetical protein